MNRPWMQFHTRDWLDSKELRRCSPAARAVLADLMCLAHEGEPYGHLADKSGPLTVKYMASRCVVSTGQFLKALTELTQHKRLIMAENSGALFVPRMVQDEDVRVRRAAGGKLSVGHPHTHPPKAKEGYPSDHPSLENDSRVRARADSLSDSSSKNLKTENAKVREMPRVDFQERFESLYSKHPVVGFKGDGESRYRQIICEAVNPEIVADAIDREHRAWCEFWDANPGEYRPAIGKYFEDGYYMKKPAAKARDSPGKRERLIPLPPTPQRPTQEQEIAAMRDLIASATETDEAKAYYRSKLTEMGCM